MASSPKQLMFTDEEWELVRGLSYRTRGNRNTLPSQKKWLELKDIDIDDFETQYEFAKRIPGIEALKWSFTHPKNLDDLLVWKHLKSIEIDYGKLPPDCVLRLPMGVKRLQLENSGNVTSSLLGSLNSLTFFFLYRCAVPTCDWIQSLDSIESLIIGECGLTEVFFRKPVPSLKHLSLSERRLSKVEGLENLENLEKLELTCSSRRSAAMEETNDVEVEGLDAIAKLSKLREVELSDAPFRNLSFLSPHRNLDRLLLRNTGTSDLSVLEGMDLSYFLAVYTQISTLRALSSSRNMRNIICEGTPLEDIEGVENMPNLSLLNISQSLVRDLSPVSHLQKFHKLDVSYCKFIDSSTLRDLPELTVLHAIHSSFSDLRGLQNSSGLSYLRLALTQVSDIRPLGEMRDLRHLNLFGTPVTDISPLRYLPEGYVLNLTRTQVSDVSVLLEGEQPERILLYDTAVPKAQIKKLRQKFGSHVIRADNDKNEGDQKMNDISEWDFLGNEAPGYSRFRSYF